MRRWREAAGAEEAAGDASALTVAADRHEKQASHRQRDFVDDAGGPGDLVHKASAAIAAGDEAVRAADAQL